MQSGKPIENPKLVKEYGITETQKASHYSKEFAKQNQSSKICVRTYSDYGTLRDRKKVKIKRFGSRLIYFCR